MFGARGDYLLVGGARGEDKSLVACADKLLVACREELLAAQPSILYQYPAWVLEKEYDVLQILLLQYSIACTRI